MDFYKNRFGDISAGRNHMFTISYQPVTGFWFCEGSNFAISHRKAWSPLTRCLHYRAARDSVYNILQYGARLIFNLNFVILDHTRSQLCGSITLSKNGVDPIFSPQIFLFYNFASLAGKCLTTPLLGFFGGLNPLKLWVVIQTSKRQILGWWRVI